MSRRPGLQRLAALFALLCVAGGITAAEPLSAQAMGDRMAACTSCHGAEGIELADGYVPRIHGKPAGYLFNQLVNYRAMRRRNRSMNHMVMHLSSDYLYEIAQYFAAREAPYPTPAPEPAVALADRGRQLVREGDAERGVPACAACHGERLAGVEPNTPGLIGLPRHYIAAQLGTWDVGTREAAAPDCMATIVDRLAPGDIEAVSAWLAARPIPSNTRPAEQPVAEPPMVCGSVALPGDRS